MTLIIKSLGFRPKKKKKNRLRVKMIKHQNRLLNRASEPFSMTLFKKTKNKFKNVLPSFFD